MEYFRSLNKRQRSQLLRLYKMDFELFGYSTKPFEDM